MCSAGAAAAADDDDDDDDDDIQFNSLQNTKKQILNVNEISMHLQHQYNDGIERVGQSVD